jgi:hypothetical protein
MEKLPVTVGLAVGGYILQMAPHKSQILSSFTLNSARQVDPFLLCICCFLPFLEAPFPSVASDELTRVEVEGVTHSVALYQVQQMELQILINLSRAR